MTPGLVSEKVVLSKLKTVSEMLAGIESLPLASEAAFLTDPRMVAAGESFLRRALEALLDIGRHILAKSLGEVVPEYAALGPALVRHRIVADDVGASVRVMGGYRNRLVHGYEEVGGAELYRILTHDLGDLVEASEALRTWLAANPDRVDRSL